MQDLNTTISRYNPINLDQMDEVKLMSRTDTKFAFKYTKLLTLLNRMRESYKVLEINDKRIHDYKSLYFDTAERKFYIDHHNSRVNRNKVRFREYIGSNLTFLEVKLKNNKGRTIKKRIRVDSITNELSRDNKEYINKIVGYPINIEAKQWINFSRMTFVNKFQKERLTIDINLTFKDERDFGNLEDIVIAEVKQERMSRSSNFMKIAKELSILPMRISKYCISTMSLNPNIKQNRFKKKELFINKLKHE